MITTERNDTKLILDQKPGAVAWLLAAFILVWVFISLKILQDGDNAGWFFLAALIVPIFFLTLVERQTLVLDRRNDSLRLTKQTIFKKRHVVEELSAVQKAKTNWHGKGTTRMGRLVIQRNTGPLEFGSPQRKSRAQKLVREVNGWLDSEGPKA